MSINAYLLALGFLILGVYILLFGSFIARLSPEEKRLFLGSKPGKILNLLGVIPVLGLMLANNTYTKIVFLIVTVVVQAALAFVQSRYLTTKGFSSKSHRKYRLVSALALIGLLFLASSTLSGAVLASVWDNS